MLRLHIELKFFSASCFLGVSFHFYAFQRFRYRRKQHLPKHTTHVKLRIPLFVWLPSPPEYFRLSPFPIAAKFGNVILAGSEPSVLPFLPLLSLRIPWLMIYRPFYSFIRMFIFVLSLITEGVSLSSFTMISLKASLCTFNSQVPMKSLIFLIHIGPKSVSVGNIPTESP